jgi:hypothetical protein
MRVLAPVAPRIGRAGGVFGPAGGGAALIKPGAIKPLAPAAIAPAVAAPLLKKGGAALLGGGGVSPAWKKKHGSLLPWPMFVPIAVPGYWSDWGVVNWSWVPVAELPTLIVYVDECSDAYIQAQQRGEVHIPGTYEGYPVIVRYTCHGQVVREQHLYGLGEDVDGLSFKTWAAVAGVGAVAGAVISGGARGAFAGAVAGGAAVYMLRYFQTHAA